MRVLPLHPDQIPPDVRYVHDEVIKLITRSQGPVSMVDADGALTGPFPPMLRFAQFGIPALSFVRSLDNHTTLAPKVKEVAILTVGSAYNTRFELYAHQIMAAHFGFSQADVAALASGNRPQNLTAEEAVAFEVATTLAKGKILPQSLYNHANEVLGIDGTAELIFLIAAYTMLAMVLNGFDVPAP